MNISLGSKRAPREHLAESPGSWASTESRHCEIWEAEWEEGAGRQVDAKLSACLLVLMYCSALDKREGGLTVFRHPEAPSLAVFLLLVASAADSLSKGKSTSRIYPPGQTTATLGGRVLRNFHTGDKPILSIGRDGYATYTSLELVRDPGDIQAFSSQKYVCVVD